MKTFSALQRQERIANLTNEVLDLLVVGGGITGVGIALDAATRGLKVGLVEMQDFAEGTSSRSTKLVHGGLRYLKQLEFKEVAELGRERAIVYENGPHVTTPVWMLLPFHEGGTFGKFTTSLGLMVYDTLAGVKSSERRYMLTREQTIDKEPLVKQQGLLGGGVYVEYRTDDARLTIEVAKAANEHGAHLVNHMKAVGFRFKNIAFTAVTVEDQLTKEQYEIKAKRVINATGPWVDQVRALDGEVQGKHLKLSKGVHLVFDEQHFPLQQAIYFDAEDGRMIFAIPRQGKTYVGTTDTFHDGDPADMYATPEDVRYILQAVAYMFPSLQLSEQHIESSWAGVRPLIHEEGKDPSEISRKDEIWQSDNGLITIAGGKLTGYRKMAEKIVDLVTKQLQTEYNKQYAPCVTKKLPISGGDLSGSKYFEQFTTSRIEKGQTLGISIEESERLARFYGTNVDQVFSYIKDASGSLPPALYAQLHYAVTYEAASKPVDFLVRRTGQLLFNMATVQKHKEEVVKEMAKLLGWTAQQTEQYKEELAHEIELAQAQSTNHLI